jgi:hypothetical protein
MSAPAGWYPDVEFGRERWWNGQTWTSRVAITSSPTSAMPPPTVATTGSSDGTPSGTAQGASDLRAEIASLLRVRDELRNSIVETRDVVLLQEVGIFRYSHPLDSAVGYRELLDALEGETAALIKSGAAVLGTKKWAINGSEKEGAKMVADFCKLLLRAYNTEADNLVRTLRPHNLPVAVERLQKMRTSISKLGSSMKIEITDAYHLLRRKELELTADYLVKLAEEREREREERIRLKEEAAARREFELEQAKLEKEKSHYEAAAAALRERGDVAAGAAAEAKVAEIQHAIDGVVARAANVRAGYVYVISNFGSFGEEIVKIGMTRRQDPMERVRELGDASVPFRYDVHAVIFSDDAVGLESELHQRFADWRVNVVNARREFFFVKPHAVRDALVALRGSLLTFAADAEAAEWRQSRAFKRPTTGTGLNA